MALISPTEYERSLYILEKGGIVAYPTETFYGLAVDPYNERAMASLYALKKRDFIKPISLIVAESSQLVDLVSHVPPVYTTLIRAFWPGPLTLVFLPAYEAVSHLAMSHKSLAIRVPAHPVARKLCRMWGGALTATSANVSGHVPLSTAADIRALWGEKIQQILDGGSTPGEKASTIVSYSKDPAELHILRQGCITRAAIIKKINGHDIVCKS